MDSPPFIAISGLSHTYPGRRKAAPISALKDVSLTIQAREMVAILGPNGSGKSTLLRILMTALRPTSGSVVVGDLDLLGNAPAVRALLGVVFQRPALDGKMTVVENLRATGLLYGIPRKELNDRVRAVLDQMDLDGRDQDLVDSLSGGLARRVELAKALLPRPRVLVLDEPTSGLDPIARQEFWRRIEALRAGTDLTVVATTHLMDEAERCDRVAILHRGELLAYDQPERLQSSIGTEVLSIEGDALPDLQADLREFLAVEGRVVDNALHLSLSAAVSVDALLDRYRDRIRKLTVSHPSLDDVFVHFTGEHLTATGSATP